MQLKTLFLSSKTTESMMVIPALPKIYPILMKRVGFFVGLCYYIFIKFLGDKYYGTYN